MEELCLVSSTDDQQVYDLQKLITPFNSRFERFSCILAGGAAKYDVTGYWGASTGVECNPKKTCPKAYSLLQNL